MRQNRLSCVSSLTAAFTAAFTAAVGAAVGALSCSPAAFATDLAARVPLTQRITAAQATAKQAAACGAVQPFYWEIGTGERSLASGSVGDGAPMAATQMALASASKWLYAAYVAERRNGRLTPDDVDFLSFRSGYTRFRLCLRGQTVDECQSSLINGRGRIDRGTRGLFDYSGGHMQKHATLMGLGALDNDALAAAIKQGLRAIGSDWSLSYTQPQLAGGGVSTAADYARFLRATLKGDLQIGKLLGTSSVCANPETCPGEALKTPIPTTETWRYSIGHWVEADPKVGDGAFSSPGAFGFYPWIDASKTFYGILARENRQRGEQAEDKPGVMSVACGRLIRQAWLEGQPQQ